MNIRLLEKMNDKELDEAVHRKCVRTNSTSTEHSLVIGRVRIFGRNVEDLIERVRNRVRHRTDISVLPHPKSKLPAKTWPVRGRGKRKFFTSKQIKDLHDKGNRLRWPLYNGCTAAWLVQEYKCDVYHEMGRGWFYYPEQPIVS